MAVGHSACCTELTKLRVVLEGYRMHFDSSGASNFSEPGLSLAEIVSFLSFGMALASYVERLGCLACYPLSYHKFKQQASGSLILSWQNFIGEVLQVLQQRVIGLQSREE